MSNPVTVQSRMLAQILKWDKGRPVWGLVTYMTPKDFDSPAMIHPLLIIMLDNVRWRATQLAGRDVKVTVTSDFRDGDDKTHGERPALGVDIRAKEARDRHFLLKAAYEVGFNRIGIYCDDDHLHLDIGDYIYPLKYDADVSWVRKCDAQ